MESQIKADHTGGCPYRHTEKLMLSPLESMSFFDSLYILQSQIVSASFFVLSTKLPKD